MPYTRAQCDKFAVMEQRGERVPADWKKHCRKGRTRKPVKRKKPTNRR